jgi:hypothetical protein
MNLMELEALLDQSRDIHLPLPIDMTHSADRRLEAKPVHKNRRLDDMTSLIHWKPVTPYIRMEISDERPFEDKPCLKVTCPTNLPEWLPHRSTGRIYAEPAAMRVFDREDWSGWNRLSVWIRPHVPGMKSIVLRIQPYNDGAHKVPDIHMREGAHNVSLENDVWNHVTVEFPHLHRDCVTGVAIEYDMCGHEPDAADTFVYYAAKLELQQVDCEVEEGWTPGPGRIAFSGSGYHPGQAKVAVAAGLLADHFEVVEAGAGHTVFTAPIQQTEGPEGEALQLLDFSAVTKPGGYRLKVREPDAPILTEPFDIGMDIWESSIWKVLNFYLSQRCGYEVPGRHRACHADLLLKHGDKAIVANGGWHDAADLAQGMANTADGTAALLLLAEALRDRRPRLYTRVLEEAKWGLDYTLKVRFGDGFRSAYSSTSIWTDGVIGTEDDIVSLPSDSPYTNFVSAHAEAIGARVFAKEDPIYARHCLRIAREDYAFGEAVWNRETGGDPDKWAGMPPVALAAAATAAAAALSLAYQALDGDAEVPQAGQQAAFLVQVAATHAETLLACQQHTPMPWDPPLSGFFWQSPAHHLVWHHNHMSQSQYPLVGLEALCQAAPDHPEKPRWMSAIGLHATFQAQTAAYTAPYGMLPEGPYHTEETKHHPDAVSPLHPQLFPDPDLVPKYRSQVEQGVKLAQDWHLRRFPVWFSFRGNGNVQLSQGVSLAIAATMFRNPDWCALAQTQLEWIVGKNPFAQSVLYGEGYDWIQQYAVQPGQAVGQLSVGIQSLFDADRPYWPQVNTATYKEVWIETANKWMWNMARSCLPGLVEGMVPMNGLIPSAEKGFRFINLKTGEGTTCEPQPQTGAFSLELPTGTYQARWQEQACTFSVTNGSRLCLTWPWADKTI